MFKKSENSELFRSLVRPLWYITFTIIYIFMGWVHFRTSYVNSQIVNRVTILDAQQSWAEDIKKEFRDGNLMEDLQVSNKLANIIKAKLFPYELVRINTFRQIADSRRFCERIRVDQRKEGRLRQQIGRILDIGFPADKMPELFHGLIIKYNHPNGDWVYVICEARIMLGNNRVYAEIIMEWGNTPLTIGMEVFDTKVPISALKGRTETFTLKDGRRTLYIPDIRMTEIRAKLKQKKPLTPIERFLFISCAINFCLLAARTR